jgi:hypothetical protein
MEKELDYATYRFTYFIIMSNKVNEDSWTAMFEDSYFNRFDSRLLETTSILELISYLPFDTRELMNSWITSANQYGKDYYYIRFIPEKYITDELLALAKNSPFGCIFLLKGVSFNSTSVATLINSSKMPIVSLDYSKTKDVLTLTHNNTKEVALQLIEGYIRAYERGLEGHNAVSSFNKAGNKTNLRSVKEASLKYITPLTRTLDRIRGLYSSTSQNIYLRVKNPTTIKNLKSREKEADKLLIKYTKQIIVEKFLLFMLGLLEEESFDEYHEAYLRLFTVSKMELNALLTDFSPGKFSEVTKKISKYFDKLSFKTDMVLCIPSINRQLLDRICESYGILSRDFIEQYGMVDKGNYYELLDAIMDGNTYYFGVEIEERLTGKILDYIKSVKAEDFKEEKKVVEINHAVYRIKLIRDHLNLLMRERTSEIEFLSQLYVLFALAQRIPYLRLRPIPFKDIYMKLESCYSVSLFDNVSDLNILFRTFSRQFADSLPKELMDLLLKHTKTLTFITDLPIEWVRLNGYPLNILKKITRIPISPGNGIISHYNRILEKKYVLRSASTKILLIDAIAEDDDVKQHALVFKLQLELLFDMTNIEFIYKEVHRKQDYFDTINTIQPDVLIHYGHGDYNEKDQGSLTLGKEKLYAHELAESVVWEIPLVILGACESNFVKSTHMNMANMFLGVGAIAVIGTYFYVEARYTTLFIVNLMKHLIFAFNTAVDFHDFGDLILMSHRTLYLFDLIHSLKERLSYRQIKLDERSMDALDRVFRDYFKYCIEKGLSLRDSYTQDKEIFKKIFRQDPVLLHEYEEMLKKDEVLYHSLFFSTLGSPDVIKIEKNEHLLDIDDLHEQLFEKLGKRRRFR